MATTRMDIRLDAEIKTKAEKAAALLGMSSLTEYVVRLMEQDATQVIARHEHMTVPDNVFDRFMQACEQSQGPNPALKDALAYTRKQGIR